MPAISPSNIEDWQQERYYKTREEFLFAIADAMHEEYKSIVDAGLSAAESTIRVSSPTTCCNPDDHDRECRKWAEVHVEAINHALRGIPEDRMRFHTCYSINMGPRIHDMELKTRRGHHSQRFAPELTRSKLPIRATSTNGRCGKP